MGYYSRSQQTSIDGVNNERGEDRIRSEDTSGTRRQNGQINVLAVAEVCATSMKENA